MKSSEKYYHQNYHKDHCDNCSQPHVLFLPLLLLLARLLQVRVRLPRVRQRCRHVFINNIKCLALLISQVLCLFSYGVDIQQLLVGLRYLFGFLSIQSGLSLMVKNKVGF